MPIAEPGQSHHRGGAQVCHLGVDLGTSGCRVMAIDGQGNVLASHSVAMPAPGRDGAGVTQDPWIWWQAFCAALKGVMPDLPCPPVSLAIAATSATVLLADADGMPLGPALMYNDARATVQARRIAMHAPADSAAHGSSSSLAKVLWLLEQYGTRQAAHVLHQADWVLGMLSSKWNLSDENNCLKLGRDPVRREWPSWLQDLGLPGHLLPEVHAPGTPVARPTAQAARALGLPADLQLCAGTTDSVAAFLATGASQPGEAVTSLGSTLVLKILSPCPIFAPQFGVYSHRLFDRWLVGGASNSGGAVMRQFFSDADMRALTPLLEPDRSTGLDYYPLCAPGERFPVCDPSWPPRITPRPAQDALFFQGMLEGIAAIEAAGYQRLKALGAPYPVSVRTVGGGAGNPAWSTIRQRLLGLPMPAVRNVDAAYGAALLGMSRRD